jgi:hypothetical protein
MSCEEHTRLEREHSQAKTRYDAARETLESKMGVTSRDEFLRLTHSIDETWVALERARYLLDRHVTEHGCEQSREASSEAAGEG